MLGRIRAGLKAAFLGTAVVNAACAQATRETLLRPDGLRRYLLARSGRPTSGKRPLVIVVHGAGASAEQVMGKAFPPSPLSVWLEIAEREDIVVIAPDAGAGGWNDCFASAQKVAKKDDVAFIASLIDKAVADYDVDASRVYLIGVSRGGLLTYRAAVEIPHKLAAFSTVLACMPPPHAAQMPTAALPALIMGCTADPLMPYRGGKFFHVLGFLDPVSSIEDSARIWRELAGLPDEPSVLEIPHRNQWDKTRVTRTMWGEAGSGLQVGLYKIENGGHAEPSSSKRYPYFVNKLTGRQNADFEVAEAAWEFFREKRAAAWRQPRS
ncbi:alpha/beta hydrolase family esterase [Duganella violaceipulchra]|uniref:Alpha/beta fold hydrolase n=1 Tax=Duganella violaceipulchra TaxID=2849652 RepID=A0AA41HAP1_9BURK|nr:alpha/beta fold hydrolase [Duganella violaceicalia]MBV6323086.1 alpha/beta fold hydrolase [Duganella violaceicalia]MCP2010128.1 polyhydroxybutyrate depolymerase [Duganella violaceicalia]